MREQPDNVKSFNIIGEVTRFLNVVYSNINGKNIELVIQLFETMNEFTAVRFFFPFLKSFRNTTILAFSEFQLTSELNV